MADLLLDPAIRVWVFMPIVLITFLIGIVRHYVAILFTTKKKVDMQALRDSQYLMHGRMLRENGRFLPKSSYSARKQLYNDETNGYFTKGMNRAAVVQNPISDPTMMTDMLKGNMLNVLPMIVIGGWINWTFSGFVTTRVPFPLTLRFKPMLQRGVDLWSLEAAWVSSASWYFLNVFGLRSIYTLVLGQDNAADQAKVMEDQMSGAAMAMPPDPKQAFKAEWEAMQMHTHSWALKAIDSDIVGISKK